MRDKLSAPHAVVSSEVIDQLFDTLSALPPLIYCRKCCTKLLQVHATFCSDSGKSWTLALPVCKNCEPPQLSQERAAISSSCRKRSFMSQFDKNLFNGPALGRALPSTTPSGPTWQQLYQRATVELDHTKLPERITDARDAILNRAEEILAFPPGSEHRALNSAFETLRMLEEVAARERLAA
jgi:hypothetical protein